MSTSQAWTLEIVVGLRMDAFLSLWILATADVGTWNARSSLPPVKAVTIDVGSGSRTKLIWLKHGFGPQ